MLEANMVNKLKEEAKQLKRINEKARTQDIEVSRDRTFIYTSQLTKIFLTFTVQEKIKSHTVGIDQLYSWNRRLNRPLK